MTRRLLTALLLWTAGLLLHAGEPFITGNTTKNPLGYAVGEEMVFHFQLMQDGKPLTGKKLLFFLYKDDGSPRQDFSRETSDAPIEVRTSIDRPGFVRIQVLAKEQDGSPVGNDVCYDGGACAGLHDIRTLGEEPHDFDAFWKKWTDALAAYEPEVTLTPVKADYPGTVLYEFAVETLPGYDPATGFIAWPEGAAEKSLTASIAFDGYSAPAPCSRPGQNCQRQICVRVNRQPLSNQEGQEFYGEAAKEYKAFCFRNNDNPETSDFLDMILRDLRGVWLAKSRPEYNGGPITAGGGSMGAFRCIAVTALDTSIQELGIQIPWCCDLSGVEHGRIGGWRPAFTPALGYFDPVFMARRIHCPVSIMAGMGDYISPPSGVLSFFHELQGQAKLTFVQSMKHGAGEYPNAPRYLLVNGFAPEKMLLQPLEGIGDLRTYPFIIGNPKHCTVEFRDGHTILCIDVPEGEESRGGSSFGIQLDPNALLGKQICLRVKFRTINVSDPPEVYLGSKFMLTCQGGPDVTPQYHDAWLPQGTNDWQYGCIYQKIATNLDKSAGLSFGMQSVHGRIEFDLDSLECGEIYTPATRKNMDYATRYSDKVANAQLRGVMSPGRDLNEDDLKTLHDWNVNLIRVQFMRNWLAMNTEMDLDEYFQWLDKRIDGLVAIAETARKYNINLILDMHSPPGGKAGWYNMRIFSEKKYTEAFIEAWKRIVTRVKDLPAVFGYDLVNEPPQGMPSEDSGFFDLQLRAAREIRKIDPRRPIIFTTLGGGMSTLDIMSLAPMDNIIYTMHYYWPGPFTHQDPGKNVAYPGVIEGEYCDKEAIRRQLQPIRDFQLAHNVRIYIGEFSAKVYAPGAEKWLKDVTDIFDEYGWLYSYHAFREWAGWSLEHDGTNNDDLHKVDMTPRLKAMLDAFARNPHDAPCIFDE